ncbi:MAG: phosphoadenosine phosphosulfate reductase family protein [Lentisphaerae bacterium]|nr:phosphoadenosine phosphosulfate reductase family protein [Lentisphaerota bacterium]
MTDMFDNDRHCEYAYSLPLPSKVAKAVDTLKEYESLATRHDPQGGYHLAFSGGKDSVVIKRLADMAGVRYRARYNVTTIDPPELVQFIKQHHPDAQWNRPARPFFSMAAEKGLPVRRLRWCCALYKEGGGRGKVKILGIRAAESSRRKHAWKILTSDRRGDWSVCPILYWTDDDVWDFIRAEGLPYCSLYDDGFKRLGCIGCPMGGDSRRTEFRRWPNYERLWRRAADAYWESHRGARNRNGDFYYAAKFGSAKEYWQWWMQADDGAADECTMGQF